MDEMDDMITHVQITFNESTGCYGCVMKNKDEEVVAILDLGEDPENVKKVVKLLEDEFGGVFLPPGWRN